MKERCPSDVDKIRDRDFHCHVCCTLILYVSDIGSDTWWKRAGQFKMLLKHDKDERSALRFELEIWLWDDKCGAMRWKEGWKEERVVLIADSLCNILPFVFPRTHFIPVHDDGTAKRQQMVLAELSALWFNRPMTWAKWELRAQSNGQTVPASESEGHSFIIRLRRHLCLQRAVGWWQLQQRNRPTRKSRWKHSLWWIWYVARHHSYNYSDPSCSLQSSASRSGRRTIITVPIFLRTPRYCLPILRQRVRISKDWARSESQPLTRRLYKRIGWNCCKLIESVLSASNSLSRK
jgi:hypothetical protein